MSELRIVSTRNGGNGSSEDAAARRLIEMAGPRPAVPEEDLAIIKTAARAAWQAKLRSPEARRFAVPRARVLALAAGLLIAVGASWWWWIGRSAIRSESAAHLETLAGIVTMRTLGEAGRAALTSVEVGQAIPVGAELDTTGTDRGLPAQAALRLVGGASLRIDAGSRVRLASLSVIELESGAVYVDSGPEPARSAALEVRTPLGVAADFGTQFEVRLLDGTAMRVRVREGMVLVEQGETSHSALTGMELTLRDDGSVVRRRVPAHGPEWRWVLDTAPHFAVEGRTLREFLDWVARETGWRLHFADQAIATAAEAVTLHGAFGDLTPDQAPEVVLPAAGLRGQVVDGTLVVSAPSGVSGR